MIVILMNYGIFLKGRTFQNLKVSFWHLGDIIKCLRREAKLLCRLALIVIAASAASLAETGGQLNMSTSNVSIVTGIYAYTVDYCNNGYECFGYACFLDWDSTGGGGRAGWCNLTGITSCYHNGTATATGLSVCDTSTSYRTCSSGTWGSSTSCSSNNTCSAGACAASSSSSSSSSSGGSSSSTGDFNQKISVLSSLSDFNITQGTKALKTIVVKNTGNRTLFNVSVSVSGIEASWVSIGPDRLNITINANATFGMEFIIPSDATAKVYDVTANVATSNSSVSTSMSFKVFVIPTEETVQKEIIPNYNNASSRLSELEKKVSGLAETCTDVKLLESNRDEIKEKMKKIQEYLDAKDYVRANTLIEEVTKGLDELNQKILNTAPGTCGLGIDINPVYVVAGVAAVGIIGVLAYLFWPQGSPTGYHPEKGWTQPKQQKLHKKKKDEFLYDFRRKEK